MKPIGMARRKEVGEIGTERRDIRESISFIYPCNARYLS